LELNHGPSFPFSYKFQARRSAVRWGTALQAEGVGWIPVWFIGISHWLNPFGFTMAMGSTQPPAKRRPVGRADTLASFMGLLPI